jgi:hypothetical protein
MSDIKIDDNFGSNQILKDIASQTHMIDIRVRMDGKYYWFEGNFLKHVLPYVTFNRLEHDISATLKGHEQIED